MTPDDHAMIHHAAKRGLVVVTNDGRASDAVLISWRPRGGRNRARVQYVRTDRQANVPLASVALP